MSQLGFYFDMTRCVGCRVCQIACKDRIGLEDVVSRTRRVDSYEAGEYPNAAVYHLSIACNHCENPACASVCPTGATYKAEDGTMRYDAELCIGCHACVGACPYQAPQPLENGKIAKCDSCFTLRENGMNPVCVDACIMRCLDFGEIDELKKKYGENLVSDLEALPDSTMTNPNLLIKAKPSAKEKNYREVII